MKATAALLAVLALAACAPSPAAASRAEMDSRLVIWCNRQNPASYCSCYRDALAEMPDYEMASYLAVLGLNPPQPRTTDNAYGSVRVDSIEAAQARCRRA